MKYLIVLFIICLTGCGDEGVYSPAKAAIPYRFIRCYNSNTLVYESCSNGKMIRWAKVRRHKMEVQIFSNGVLERTVNANGSCVID